MKPKVTKFWKVLGKDVLGNFDKIAIALPYLINVLSTLIPDISTIIANIES